MWNADGFGDCILLLEELQIEAKTNWLTDVAVGVFGEECVGINSIRY